MVTVNNVERRNSSRLRVFLAAVALGVVALAVSAAFGMWQLGIVLGIAVGAGSLTPPFRWR